jgi:hypothetical protein
MPIRVNPASLFLKSNSPVLGRATQAGFLLFSGSRWRLTFFIVGITAQKEKNTMLKYDKTPPF